MKSRRDGASVTEALVRLIFGDRPKADPEFEAALDTALTRAKEKDVRLAALQERLRVLQRR